MLIPIIYARIEKSNDFVSPGVNTVSVVALGDVAMWASEAQIFRGGVPAG
jgi:hypothetical protein